MDKVDQALNSFLSIHPRESDEALWQQAQAMMRAISPKAVQAKQLDAVIGVLLQMSDSALSAGAFSGGQTFRPTLEDIRADLTVAQRRGR